MHFFFFPPVESEAAGRDCFLFVPHFTIMHTPENGGPVKILLLGGVGGGLYVNVFWS